MKNKQHIPSLQQRVTALERQIETLSSLQETHLEERIAQLEKNRFIQRPLLTVDEASAFLGISHAFLYKLTSKKMIPYLKPRAKMVYFDKEELITWIRQSKIDPLLRTVTFDDIRKLCME